MMNSKQAYRRQSDAVMSLFTSEIQSIMHGFGDCPRPMLESACLVEEIVHREMVELLQQAAIVAAKRNVRSIGLEDILFLMRKDKVKLARLIRYLVVKDFKAGASSIEEEVDGSATISSALSESKTMSKRKKLCYEFLASIDQTGELLAVFDEDFFDEIRYKRNLRMDRITSKMTQNQYLRYSEARRANFSRKIRPEQFKEWLCLNESSDMKLNAYALEVLQYLAYETVAQIIDMALLVKQDTDRSRYDPVSGLLPRVQSSSLPQSDAYSSPITSNFHGYARSNRSEAFFDETSFGNKRARNSESKGPHLEISIRDCITPQDIKDALRRYNQPMGSASLVLNRQNITKSKLLSL
ncbi:transcription initiation protein Spt3 [Brevipalpus obovatus]|uniref:transcription initiation protein Spt3 n=1 Tax=Brevipalpus obovatus TaxID=246614 RepID=UPI003D9E85A0